MANLAGLRRSYARAAGELPIGFGFQPERAQEFANPHASWRSVSKVSGGVSGHSGVLVGLAALDARPPQPDLYPADWLHNALIFIGAVVEFDDAGTYPYALRVGSRGLRCHERIVGEHADPYPNSYRSPLTVSNGLPR